MKFCPVPTNLQVNVFDLSPFKYLDDYNYCYLSEDGNDVEEEKRIMVITCQMMFDFSAVLFSPEQNSHYQPTAGQLIQV